MANTKIGRVPGGEIDIVENVNLLLPLYGSVLYVKEHYCVRRPVFYSILALEIANPVRVRIIPINLF